MSEPIHVLHVDDDPDFAGLVATYLERTADGFVVETATNADAGLARLDDGEIDCVVSDYDMPGRNGIEFLGAVRDRHDDLPFVLFTGKGSEEIASDAISAGVTDYLRKGRGTDRYEILGHRISNAVGAYRSRTQSEARRKRLAAILKTVPGCVTQLNRDGEFVFVNERAEAVLGLERTDVTDRRYNDPEWRIRDLDGEPIPDAELPFRKVRDTGEPVYGCRHTIEWPDGTEKELLVNGAPLFEDGRVESVVFSMVDVTDRRERERTLKETEKRLELAIEATDTGVWEWDVETDTVVWDETLERVMGLEPGSFEGTYEAFAERVHPDDLPAVTADVERALETGGEYRSEFRMFRADGEVLWVEGRAQIVDDGDGRRLIGIHHDVTDRKRRERELERRNELLEEFAGVVSHDLRSPLTVAQGRVELAAEECDSADLDAAADALDRGQALIGDLLELVREGAGTVDPEPVSLTETVRRCWRTVETANAALVVEATATIDADPSRLQQLLQNLVRNAVEHGGSDVTVTVGDLSDGFYVADDGPGIPADERGDVFETGYSTVDENTGFGLGIVARVAADHGWSVTVTEGADGGARFEVTGVETISRPEA
jgi:PAS domain S-box-containing protein